MQELLEQLFDYLRGILRYKWIALLVAWIVSLSGWFWIAQMPEQYLATAKLHIDSNSILRPLLRGLTVRPDVNHRVALMSKTMLVRPNLEKLMRMADLDLQVRGDADTEKLLNTLRDNISLGGDRRNASLYSVAFKHPDRNTAKKIVQSLITVFVENTLGNKRIESAGAQEFLNKEIAEYERRLAEAETRLADFQRKHVGAMPGDTGGYYSSLQTAKSQLKEVRLQLKELNNRRLDLENQLEDEEPEDLLGGFDELLASPQDERIRSMQMRMDNLLLKYTERHPEVKYLKGMIANLEKEKQQYLEEKAGQEQSLVQNQSPVYLQIRSMLSETEARIAELNVRADEYSQRMKALEKKIDNIPKIEAEFKQLDRDYSVISSQHSKLLQRRESARLSDSAERDAGDVKFRVIDPPFVPMEPTEPNKLLLNGVVFIISFGAGIGLAFLISLLHPVFSTRVSLSQGTGLPVLGTVFLMRTTVEKRKVFLNRLLFLSLVASLFITFTAVSLGQEFGFDFIRNLEGLRARIL